MDATVNMNTCLCIESAIPDERGAKHMMEMRDNRTGRMANLAFRNGHGV